MFLLRCILQLQVSINPFANWVAAAYPSEPLEQDSENVSLTGNPQVVDLGVVNVEHQVKVSEHASMLADGEEFESLWPPRIPPPIIVPPRNDLVMCSLCDGVFMPEYMTQHVATYHTRHYFQFCPISFSRLSRLGRYIRLFHGARRRYSCKRCGVAFHYRRELYNHVQLCHNKYLPYLCNLCCCRFTNRELWESHERALHPQLSKNSNEVTCCVQYTIVVPALS